MCVLVASGRLTAQKEIISVKDEVDDLCLGSISTKNDSRYDVSMQICKVVC